MSTQSFNIVLPRELVEKADKLAKEEFRNRSELIREAVRLYVLDKERSDNLLLEKIFDVTDALEAEKAKKEPKRPFGLYLKKRWQRSKI